jgi:predicted NAD/FAD-binding protein
MRSVKGCQPVFQTWHPTVPLNPKLVLARATFERPLVTFDTLNTLNGLKQRMQQPGNTLWFCGSYLGGGIPLLEAGVRSALNVANALGVYAPWQSEG